MGKTKGVVEEETESSPLYPKSSAYIAWKESPLLLLSYFVLHRVVVSSPPNAYDLDPRDGGGNPTRIPCL